MTKNVVGHLAKLGTASAAEKKLERTGVLKHIAKSVAKLTRLGPITKDLIENALTECESALRRLSC